MKSDLAALEKLFSLYTVYHFPSLITALLRIFLENNINSQFREYRAHKIWNFRALHLASFLLQ